MSKEVNDKLLLEAALAEFSTSAYQNASVNRIIDRSGLSKGSFYYRFSTKFELYVYLLKRCAAEKWRFINECMGQANEQNRDGDIFDRFREQLDISSEFGRRYPEYERLYQRFTKERGTEHFRKAVEELATEDSAGLPGMITTARDSGELNSRYTADFMAVIISHLFSGFSEMFGLDIIEGTPERREKLMSDLISFLRQGFGG